MLMTDLVQEYAQTYAGLLADIGMDTVHAEIARLAEAARDDLARGGFASEDGIVEAEAALRYFGQEHALEVPVQKGDDLDALRDRFDGLHRQRYGHAMADPVQLVHLRVRGIGRNRRPELQAAPSRASGTPEPRTVRPAWCFAARAIVDFAVYRRDALCAGDAIDGPAIVEEATTTLVFGSDQRATVDSWGHLFIVRKDAS
jgi:N-methylhydantoinase A